MIKRMARHIGLRVLSARTYRAVTFDLLRWRTRVKRHILGTPRPSHRRLHLGCGKRRVEGWLNVDLVSSECDVDLACGRLPWPNDSFDAVVCQHVIEHLELREQLLPLLRELRRVVEPGGEVWLSCPDIAKACRSYLDHGMQDLYDARLKRLPDFTLPNGVPTAHMINELFHQWGEHVNLFDLELLTWALKVVGFTRVTRVDEDTLLERFKGFPRRNDDEQSLYVCVK